MRVLGPYIATYDNTKRAFVRMVEGKRGQKGYRQTTMFFSRFLMQQKLGRKLGYDETVDHIDNDPSNDDIDNLQILSRSENALKGWAFQRNIVDYHAYITKRELRKLLPKKPRRSRRKIRLHYNDSAYPWKHKVL